MIRTFISVLIRGFRDPAFREKLRNDPGGVVTKSGLLRSRQLLWKAYHPEQDFNTEGHAFTHKLLPNRVSERFMVVPTTYEDPVPEGLIPIYLDQRASGASLTDEGRTLSSGRAFGSGLHASTYLCLVALEAHFTGAPEVLDIGTGTGILALAAAKLGAKQILAIDVDESAIEIASSNVRVNGLETNITVELGSIERIDGMKFDLVLANLTRSVHLKLLKEGMIDLITPEGKQILSGIRDSEVDEVREAIDSAEGVIVDQYSEGEWNAFVVQLNQ